MTRLYYSTGQVAQQLGVTLATVRTLCANGVVKSETSPGGHLRVPAAEMERLLREGLPPIPRPLPAENAPATNGTNGSHAHPEFLDPSDEVALAAEAVAITRSTLEKRKIEREIEENEDFFRERQQRKAAAETAERQKAEAKQAEQRRLKWIQEWTQYAMNSLPYHARQNAEMEVHAAVQGVLSALDPSQPQMVTQRLVDAVVHQTLAPWTRNQEIERALQASMNALAWDIQYRLEHAALKQRAWDAAVAAVGRVRAEAKYSEMETAAVQAVQPMIREYKHHKACDRMVGDIYIFDATREEREAATEAVRKALAALPIGADQRQFEMAQHVALTPYKAAVAARKERARQDSEALAARRVAASKADSHLEHVAKYFAKEYTFDGGDLERLREVNRLRPMIREALIDELVEDSEMTAEEIRESIEDQVDDALLES